MRTRTRRWIGVTCGVAALAAAAWIFQLEVTKNFGTIVEGEAYRSAQLDAGDLGEAIDDLHLKSILNLRGAKPGERWYDDEVAVAKNKNVTHYDYPLHTSRFVTQREIGELLELVKTAPKPILIHCSAGADRTGLMSALYRYALEGESADEAVGELSARHLLVPFVKRKANAMDESFWAYARSSTQAKSVSPSPK